VLEAPAQALSCIIPHSAVVDDLERRLQFALVAYVGGSRPAVSCQQVADALAQRVGIPREAFSVHKYHPEDFLIVFASGELRDRVTARPSLPYGHFTLFFRRWTRLAAARCVKAPVKVRLAIEGIPPHAWDKSTVEHLLGTSCSLSDLAPETASRADLGLFKVSAWTREVNDIPPARLLWVPEPANGIMPGGPRPVRRNRELGLLEYKVLIHVSRIEEYVAVEGPAGMRSSPGSDHQGQDNLDDGYWTSRNLHWTSGIQDRRGPSGGSGGGHGGGGGGYGGQGRFRQLPPSGPIGCSRPSTVQSSRP
jgi:uncharacterized membrane protein YgcG